jgi:hypothetical protein
MRLSGQAHLSRRHRRSTMKTKKDEKKDEVPAIEPPCSDCELVRAQSGGTQEWCARHTKPVHGHAYGYQREHKFSTHDSSVIPTGTSEPFRR